MAFFFGAKKQQGASELVKLATTNVWELFDQRHANAKQADVIKSLAAIKEMIAGTVDTAPDPQKVADLVDHMVKEDFFYTLARSFPILSGGPVRKDAQSILNHAFRFRPADRLEEEAPALTHIIDDRPEVIIELCRGYEVQDCATSCGAVLKEVIKNQDATTIIFYDQHTAGEATIRLEHIDSNLIQSGEGVFWRFFEYVKEGKFEVSTDAFNIFRDILTKHKALTATYLTVNFELFFQKYHANFVKSDSYVTIRQSIKLLGELLLDRANYQVMTRYVEDREHLKLFMMLMRDTRQMIKYEAFHVFKVFVANPKKSEGVKKMLIQNRNQLLRFLPAFLSEKDDNDEQFRDEKAFLIKQINNLPSVYDPPDKEPVIIDSTSAARENGFLGHS